MKEKINKYFSILLILISGPVFSQPDENGIAILSAGEDSLRMLGEQLFTSEDVTDRVDAAYAMIPVLVRALKVKGSYEYPFNDQKFISVVNSDDNKFRVFTWHLELTSGTYRHFGALQMRSKSDLVLYPLIDASIFMDNRDTVVTNEYWYGAIYYKITSKKSKEKKYYFLFGYDANDRFSTRKVVDVLHFTESGPVLGAPVFFWPETDSTDEKTVNRLIIEYTKGAGVTLNFSRERKMIIFDHLVPRNPLSSGVYSTYIPDGTYEGFRFRKGKWVYVNKVFTESIDAFDDPPVPKPLDFDLEEKYIKE